MEEGLEAGVVFHCEGLVSPHLKIVLAYLPTPALTPLCTGMKMGWE